MYPTISHLIEDLFGVNIPLPIQTFGFFVALAFFSAAYILQLELKRREKLGQFSPIIKKELIGKPASMFDFFSNALIWFFVGFKLIELILNYSDFVDNPQAMILSLQGNIIGGFLGFFYGIYSKYIENKKQLLKEPKWIEKKIHPFELVGNITMVAAISGLLGAKIFHNLENIDELIADPITALLSFSGLTFYGGLICGTIAVGWYIKKYKMSFLYTADSIAPGLILAYGVGRIGCQMAGDGDWGIENTLDKPKFLSFLPDWMWAFDYPGNVLRKGIPIDGCNGPFCYVLETPVFPTPFYETIMALVIFGILLYLRKRILIPGMIFSIYLIMNGIERFWIEKIRVNANYNIFNFGITQAEIISSLLFFTGIVFSIYLFKRHKKNKPIW